MERTMCAPRRRCLHVIKDHNTPTTDHDSQLTHNSHLDCEAYSIYKS